MFDWFWYKTSMLEVNGIVGLVWAAMGANQWSSIRHILQRSSIFHRNETAGLWQQLIWIEDIASRRSNTWAYSMMYATRKMWPLISRFGPFHYPQVDTPKLHPSSRIPSSSSVENVGEVAATTILSVVHSSHEDTSTTGVVGTLTSEALNLTIAVHLVVFQDCKLGPIQLSVSRAPPILMVGDGRTSCACAWSSWECCKSSSSSSWHHHEVWELDGGWIPIAEIS